MKITDLKCAVIGKNPIVRIVTDEGISGYGEVEQYKPYLKPLILQFREALIGHDPTDVERVMLRIRQRGSFKPYGSAISVIEHALWDIAGKAAGVPVYKLLGGKIRDQVRVYNGAVRFPFKGYDPEDYAEDVRKMKDRPEGFTIVKQGITFHSNMKREVKDFYYGEPDPSPFHGALDRGLLTERGMKHAIACVEAMKEVLGDEIGLALDCGPGWMVPDAIRFARALEPLNIMWLEDMITGDYVPFVNADVYREVTQATTTPIHTGEQIYLRQNYKQLIESHAVRIVGPDPCDVGGLAELKWIAEYADLHGILMAPHGVGNGVLGLAALVQVSATLPAQLHRLRVPGRRSRLVVRHRRGPARSDRQERHDRGLGPAGHGRRHRPREGAALSRGRGRRLLRLTRGRVKPRPRGRGPIRPLPSALHAGGEHDRLGHPALEDQVDDGDRQAGEHSAGEKPRVVDAEGILHLGDADGDRHHVLGLGDEERPQERVPGADEGDDGQRRRHAPVHRQEDAEEELELVRPVDDRGLAELARHGIEELLVDDDDHRGDELRQDDAEPGVEQLHIGHDDEMVDDQRLDRHHEAREDRSTREAVRPGKRSCDMA